MARAEKRLIGDLIERGTPLLGVCLGGAADRRGGGRTAVERLPEPEIGWHEVSGTGTTPHARFRAFEWHSYGFDCPPGAAELARNEVGCQAFRLGQRPLGIQFHAEVDQPTVEGWLRDYGSRKSPASTPSQRCWQPRPLARSRRWNDFRQGALRALPRHQ